MIVLDSDVLIEIERGSSHVRSKLARLRSEHPENLAITSAVYAELLFGLLKRKKWPPAHLQSFDVLEFDKASAEIFARKKAELERKGTPIPIFDLLTASCVMAHDALLVSFDRHFAAVSGLRTLLLEPVG